MKDVVLGIVRHLLTAGGGALTAKGWAASSEVEAAIGAVVTLVGFVWSVMQKRKSPPTASK